MALLIITTVFALVYGLLNQISKNIWVTLLYTVIVLFGSTTMYLIGWKFGWTLDNRDNQNEQNNK
jgi:membrane protein DedA with SNARE-associated domain